MLTILEKSNVYSLGEVNKVQNMLEKLQNQKDVERAKHKADSLLASKEYDACGSCLSINRQK